MEREHLLIVPEVAERLGASAHTVRRWVREGKLHAVLGSSDRSGYWILESELTRFMAGCATSPSTGWAFLDRWVHGSMAEATGPVRVIVVGVDLENGKVRYRRLLSPLTVDPRENDLRLGSEEEGPLGAFTALPGQKWS